jgi:ubiquinone/menaquinone biosynthesis C-methylase UbiE
MEARLQRRVQRYGWDKASSYYEPFWQEQLKPAQDLLVEMARLQRGDQVLDVACGTGLVSFRVLEVVGDGGRVLGTDISDKMVDMARAVASERGEGRAHFEQMDAEELRLEDGQFDVALCALGLMYMPDPRRALEEMRRVLRARGRAVAAVWGQRDRCGWADIFDIVDRHVASEVCPMFFNLGNPNMLELTFKVAGFRDVEVRRIETVLWYKDSQEALGAAFVGGPVALAYHKFPDAVKAEVHHAYLASIEPFRQHGGYAIPGEFVVAQGV